MSQIEKKPVYLGDGLYALDDGFQIQLITERADCVHEVYLDGSVLLAFMRFIQASRNVKITITENENV